MSSSAEGFVVTNKVWKYIKNGDPWELQTALRRPRAYHRTEIINGDIYHVGGCQNNKCGGDGMGFENFRFEKRFLYDSCSLRLLKLSLKFLVWNDGLTKQIFSNILKLFFLK